jgi:hypothetical protein
MFTYRETIEARRAKIEAFLTKEHSAVAVIMAAANFEWTLRRAILALGMKPTAALRKEIEKTSSLENYKKVWKQSVSSKTAKSLPSIITNWASLKEAYQLRNELVHGNEGTTGMLYAKKRVVVLLLASEAINSYVISREAAIFGKKIRRIKLRK